MTTHHAPAPEIEPLMTPHEVMACLKCSRSFVQRHRAELGARKLGNLLLFERAEVDAWIERSRVTAPQPAPEPEPTPIRPSIDATGLPAKNPVTLEEWPWNRSAKANR